jgi:hypothetical protein
MRHPIAPGHPILPIGPFRWLLGLLLQGLPRRLIPPRKITPNLLIFLLLTVYSGHVNKAKNNGPGSCANSRRGHDPPAEAGRAAQPKYTARLAL